MEAAEEVEISEHQPSDRIPKFDIVKIIFALALLALAYTYQYTRLRELYLEKPQDETSIDGWIYYIGLKAFHELGENPYNNNRMMRLLLNRKIVVDAVDHNRFVNGFRKIHAGSPIIGFMATPCALLILRPVLLLSAQTAIAVFITGTIFVLAIVVAMFAYRLSRAKTRVSRIADTLIAVALCAGASSPLLTSALLGQIDWLYLLPLGLVLYAHTFWRHTYKTAAACVVGLVLVAGIKVFPGIIFLPFVIMGIEALLRSWKKQPLTRNDSQQTEMSDWLYYSGIVIGTIAGFAALVTLTGIVVEWHIISTWQDKLLGMKHLEPAWASLAPSLEVYATFLARWIAIDSGSIMPVFELQYLIPPVVSFFVLSLVVVALGYRVKSSARELILLECGMLLALLPSVLPHWWYYYHVVMVIPLLAAFFVSRDLRSTALRWCLTVAIAISYLSMNAATKVISTRLFPGLRVWWERSEAIAPYPEISYLEYPLAYSPSPMNFFIGYPGSLLLFLACAVTLIARKHELRQTAN
ncbi:glycosyltransferase 87 family protein [Patescibacteria group bacterium]